MLLWLSRIPSRLLKGAADMVRTTNDFDFQDSVLTSKEKDVVSPFCFWVSIWLLFDSRSDDRW